MTTDFQSVLKGKTPLAYLRVSSSEQAAKGSGIRSQKDEIEKWLKAHGIRKKPKYFQEQVSGGKAEDLRKQFTAMLRHLFEQKDPSKFFILMRDFTRWSRHTIYGPHAARQLYDNGVEIVSTIDNASTGHSTRPDPNGEFLFGLWMALGGRERTGAAEKIRTGIESAKGLGRVGGQPLDPDQPWETMVANWYRFELPRGADEKIGYKQASNDWKVTRGWVRGALDRFRRFKTWLIAHDMEVQPELNRWLEVMERLREVKRVHGKGSDIFREAQASTSGILKKPELYWSLVDKVGTEKAFAELEVKFR
uniref:Resolvase/invertase-type recombinase catalytic domain-containing protein n=1 Tax=uncultured marine group II/III euryarchaeote KM3_180_D08 TaxID=1457942 RepID=A0A075GSI0_9EURY|nr:hypothetical protein [uncultured marine group II/III euryarchaeote KM3_180_D08]